MNYAQWKPIYEQIILDLQLDKQEDIRAAKLLDELLYDNPNTHTIDFIKHLIYKQEVVIFGAGPSLEFSIQKHQKIIKNTTRIAADGATSTTSAT